MNRKIKILYVEDDETLSFVTRDNLELRGYQVDHCTDGQAALKMFAGSHYDICVFDVMLPKLDGFTLARHIRGQDEQIPIIFLTAKSAKEDKIEGLRLGGDDYITKPYSIEELVLKIEIFLKRSRIFKPDNADSSFAIGRYVFRPGNQELSLGEQQVALTHRESELLLILAESVNNIVRREDILNRVWGNDHFFSSRSLDVFISRLRKHLSGDPAIRIDNVHNVGYRLNTQV